MRLKLVTIAGLIAAALGAAAWQLRSHRAEASEESAKQQARQNAMVEARTKGFADAPITIFEASDFQCPFCRRFWEETLPLLEREYIETGKARLIFLNFPLVSIHPNAAAAHELAMCAAQQERFWPVHDLLYRYQAAWKDLSDPAAFFMALADSAALSHEPLMTCLNSGAVRGLIQAEAQMSVQSGLSSTPTFIIERGILTGHQPIEVWRTILDSIFVVKTGN